MMNVRSVFRRSVVASLVRGAALVLALVGISLSGELASAATISWANTSSNWTTGANWVGGVAPLTTDQASFPGAGLPVNPSIPNSAVTIDSIVIDNTFGNYNIVRQGTSSQLNITPTLTGGASPTLRGISVNTGLTQIGTQAAGMKINMVGDQTWNITGNLTFFGGNSNSAWVNSSARLTKTGAGTLTFNNLNGSNLTPNGTYGGSISAITMKGGTFTGVSGQINLTGTGTGTNAALVMEGGTTVSFGLAVDAPNNDQTIKFSGTSGTATINGVTKTTNANGTRTLNFDIDNGSADVDMVVGTIGQYANSPGNPTVNMVKTGLGTLRLNSGGSTYSGTTTLSRGQLLVGGNAPVSLNGALGNSATAVQIGSASTQGTDNLSLLVDGGDYTIARNITINSQNAIGFSTLGVNTANDATFSGVVTLNNHSMHVYAATNGTVTFANTINASAGLPTVVKAGNGTAIFSVANNYGGGTTVGAGTLLVNNSTGSGTGSGAVLVQGGATLGGIGNIGGSVTVENNAHLAPGQSAGTLSVGGNVVFNSGSNFDVEIAGVNAADHDRLTVTGTATLGGSINITHIGNLNFAPQNNDQIVLLSASNITGEFANAANGQVFKIGDYAAQLYYFQTQVLLTNFGYVPEPSSLLMFSFGGMALLRARRRQRRTAVKG